MNYMAFGRYVTEKFNNFEYKKTLKIIQKYMRKPDSGIYDRLIYMYIVCEINQGLIDDAFKNIQLAQKIWPDMFEEEDLAEKYIMCDKPELAEKILNKKYLRERDYFYVARSYLLFGYYEYAKKWFKYYISISKEDNFKDKSIKYLNEINNYETNNGFISIDYGKFKRLGNKLEQGYVIYSRSIRDNIYGTDDDKKNVRPYMVWKVIDKKIYAFPVAGVSQSTKDYNHILSKEKYANFDFDRFIKDHLICIEESDVEKVIDKIKQEDYEKSLEAIYRSICFRQDDDNEMFFKEMNQNLQIEKGSVLLLYDAKYKVKYYYYVLNVDLENNNIEALELSKNGYEYTVISGDVFDIRRDDYIMKQYITNFQKEQIESQLNNLDIKRYTYV